jgi:hypothetical protein
MSINSTDKSNKQRRIVPYLDSFSLTRVLRDQQARPASLLALRKAGRLQSQTQGELDALLPSVLDRAFKGEL